MQIDVKAVADLDFAFKVAPDQGLLDPATDTELAAAIPILARLSVTHGFHVDQAGLPCRGGTMKASDGWAKFAADAEGTALVQSLHAKLITKKVWIWPMGSMEEATSAFGKGEQAIQQMELSIPQKTAAQAAIDFSAIVDLMNWVKPL